MVTVGLASELFGVFLSDRPGVFLSDLSEDDDPALCLCGLSPEYPLLCLGPGSTDLGFTLKEALLLSPLAACLPGVLFVLPRSGSSGLVFLGTVSFLKIDVYINYHFNLTWKRNK